jgi:hypothetical protein
MNTNPDYVLDISRPPRRTHSQRATSCRNPTLFRSPTSRVLTRTNADCRKTVGTGIAPEPGSQFVFA